MTDTWIGGVVASAPLWNGATEDDLRGYRPKPCEGWMHFEEVENCTCFISAPCSACVNNPLICDTCGEKV